MTRKTDFTHTRAPPPHPPVGVETPPGVLLRASVDDKEQAGQRVTVTFESTGNATPIEVRIRRLLKHALRGLNLKAVEVTRAHRAKL